MAGISVSGVGSGLDLNGLVTQLIAAEAEPAQRRLNTREAELQARISAYGTLKSALSAFRGSLANADNPASFQSFRATSADSASITASSVTVSGKPSDASTRNDPWSRFSNSSMSTQCWKLTVAAGAVVRSIGDVRNQMLELTP